MTFNTCSTTSYLMTPQTQTYTQQMPITSTYQSPIAYQSPTYSPLLYTQSQNLTPASLYTCTSAPPTSILPTILSTLPINSGFTDNSDPVSYCNSYSNYPERVNAVASFLGYPQLAKYQKEVMAHQQKILNSMHMGANGMQQPGMQGGQMAMAHTHPQQQYMQQQPVQQPQQAYPQQQQYAQQPIPMQHYQA